MQFKVRYVSGVIRQIEAQRAVRDETLVSFENRTSIGWEAQLQAPVETIESIRRRITDLDGTWRWIPYRPQHAPDGSDRGPARSHPA